MLSNNMVDDDGSLRRAAQEIKLALHGKYNWVNRWVGDRGAFTKLLFGGFSAVTLNSARSYVPLSEIFAVTEYIPSFSTEQLLVVVIGVVIGQTIIQKRGFNQIQNNIQSEAPNRNDDARPDGGRRGPSKSRKNRPNRSRGPNKPMSPESIDTADDKKESDASGGGMIGGAIAGAALGSSWGPGGTIGGAIIGAVLGDELEQRSEESPEDEFKR